MKKQIAFVTGGYSGEAVISYESAKTIEANVDREKYDLYKIDIRKEGWYYNPEPKVYLPINKEDFTVDVAGKKLNFDAVLCGIHGTPGEDGKLQGYFDMIGLPYTACDVATSAITFNKRYTVALAAFSGIPVAKSLHYFKSDSPSTEEILNKISLPAFVKPNNGGSSIGMSKVSKATELQVAITKAFNEDDQILIEEFISGTELTIGVFKKGTQIIPLPITEIRSKTDFFDYEAKYTTGMADEITPAPVSNYIKELIEDQAVKLYRIFNCKGVVRIDFIYNPDQDKAYMLEINTVPGQSANSLVPQQVRASGATLKDFYSALIESCLV